MMDSGNFLNSFFKNKDNVVIVVMIAIAIFIANDIYKKQIVKYSDIRTQINSEFERSKTIDRIIALNEDIKKAKQKSWSTLDINVIIDEINKIGIDTKMKIRGISPAGKIDEKNYVLIPLVISCEASYKNLILFCKRLENYPMYFIITSLSAHPLEDVSGSGGKELLLSLNIMVSALYLK